MQVQFVKMEFVHYTWELLRAAEEGMRVIYPQRGYGKGYLLEDTRIGSGVHISSSIGVYSFEPLGTAQWGIFRLLPASHI